MIGASRLIFGLPAAVRLWHLSVFGLAALSTIIAYFYADNRTNEQAATQFQREVSELSVKLTERMSVYEDALKAAVAMRNVFLHETGNRMERTNWNSYARALDLELKYPGLNGIGVIYRVDRAEMPEFLAFHRQHLPEFALHPRVDADVNYPITFIAPEERNRAAIGLDMAFEQSRLTGLLAAAATGTTQMTAPIVLVQDSNETPGFLLYAPFFDTVQQNGLSSQRFAGAVYAPFIMERLIEGTLGNGYRAVLIQIHDGNTELYAEPVTNRANSDPNPMFRETVSVPMFGRVWTIDVETSSIFRSFNDSATPELLLATGLLIELIMLALYIGLGKANTKAFMVTNTLNEALQIEKRELEASNLALEHYSYLSSHDLRTPLRGMHDVTDDLREDLRSLFPDVADDPQISHHFRDLHLLIGDLDTLIGSMVTFARVGHNREDRSRFATRDVLPQILAGFRRDCAEITVTGDLPDIQCNRELFSVIVTNLITHALANHARPSNAHIAVTCQAIGRALVMQFEDDGPGLAPHLQWQIFDTTHKTDKGDGASHSDLGLAIVKRAVTAIGGYVTVTSEPGNGCAFTVMLIDIVTGDTDNSKMGQALLPNPPVEQDAA